MDILKFVHIILILYMICFGILGIMIIAYTDTPKVDIPKDAIAGLSMASIGLAFWLWMVI